MHNLIVRRGGLPRTSARAVASSSMEVASLRTAVAGGEGTRSFEKSPAKQGVWSAEGHTGHHFHRRQSQVIVRNRPHVQKPLGTHPFRLVDLGVGGGGRAIIHAGERSFAW
jgi:hypothetical protein